MRHIARRLLKRFSYEIAFEPARCNTHLLFESPYTVNERHDIQRMREMGVDGIVSDFPDRI